MAGQRRNQRLIGVTILDGAQWGPDIADRSAAGGGELDGGLVLRHRFSAAVDDPELGYGLTLTVGVHRRRLAIEQAVIAQRESGQPVTSPGLRRARLDGYLGAVRQALVGEFGLLIHEGERARVLDPDGITREVTTWSGPSGEDLLRFAGAQHRSPERNGTLRAATAAYLEALADPDPRVFRRPTAVAAERLSYSRGHVARLLTEARRVGLLGPAAPGRAGELT